nr:hypothetical protein [Tanacetum cinerariifolium]
NDLNLFTLKVNHGGVFTYVYGPKRTRAPRRVYKGDENVRNVSNDLRDENVEEFDLLFSYLHMQIDNNEGSDCGGGGYNRLRGVIWGCLVAAVVGDECCRVFGGNSAVGDVQCCLFKRTQGEVPANTDPADSRTGRTITATTEDMQKKKNDVKARTTLLLSLPDEHQLRLQVIVSQLQFMDVEVEKDDLNQKFLTSLAPEWMMHTIVWRNRNDLDTMSLDDLYNHLKVYEAEVQTKSNSNSQNMAFISSSKNSNGNEDGNIACVSTASITFPTGNVNVATISQDTASAYIASQSNGSQIKFEDINQIDEDDMEEMHIKWSMALLSMRADKFWKRTGNKISIQGSNVAGFDKSKVECFNCHKMGHFARECRAPRSQERGRKENYRQGSKTEEKTPKALMAIDGVRWDWSYMANKGEDHALVADGKAPTEFALMANTESKVFDNSLCSNECKKNTDSLNSKIKDLKSKLSEANNYIYHYKLAVAQLEGRLTEYKEREVKYIEKN